MIFLFCLGFGFLGAGLGGSLFTWFWLLRKRTELDGSSVFCSENDKQDHQF